MIYTQKGDKGMTTLIGGRSVSKADMQVDVYGTIDELNSHIGLAMAFLREINIAGTTEIKEVLEKIQKELFLLGNLYASDINAQFSLPFITEESVNNLEKEINKVETILPPLKEFILPNGNIATCQLHVCRTVCRRLERLMVSFENSKAEAVKNPENFLIAQKYINRLSDSLFVFARLVSQTP